MVSISGMAFTCHRKVFIPASAVALSLAASFVFECVGSSSSTMAIIRESFEQITKSATFCFIVAMARNSSGPEAFSIWLNATWGKIKWSGSALARRAYSCCSGGVRSAALFFENFALRFVERFLETVSAITMKQAPRTKTMSAIENGDNPNWGAMAFVNIGGLYADNYLSSIGVDNQCPLCLEST